MVVRAQLNSSELIFLVNFPDDTPPPPPSNLTRKTPVLENQKSHAKEGRRGGRFEISGLDGKLKNNNNNKCMGVPHANGIYWEVLREYSQD
jgi:hypothetical protein